MVGPFNHCICGNVSISSPYPSNSPSVDLYPDKVDPCWSLDLVLFQRPGIYAYMDGHPNKECKTTFVATIPAEIVTHSEFELYS